MKRATLDSTDENILAAIKKSSETGRNRDIIEFIEALEMIEGNMFIALDARWGEGKTFYVRQIEKTLEYLTLKKYGDNENAAVREKVQDLDQYFEGTGLAVVETEQSYLPVYYNAWEYDNHPDPLLSLLYVVVKKCGKLIDSKLTKTKLEIIKDVIGAIQKNFLSVTIDGGKIVDAFSEKNIFEDIQLAEEIREKVKMIFDEVIVEKAQKLVIFIDELDRCKPDFAMAMLERIKHYFDDDRIIFIVSVNKEQLTHTISNCYGAGFDSTGYLNKFFDRTAYLPEMKIDTRMTCKGGNEILEKMANGLAEYYNLSLRDVLIYNERIASIDNSILGDRYLNSDYNGGICTAVYVSLIIILGMKDAEGTNRFLDGSSKILTEIKELPFIQEICRGLGWRADAEERLEKGFEILCAVYDYSFKNDKDALYRIDMYNDRSLMNIKDNCMKLVGLKL